METKQHNSEQPMGQRNQNGNNLKTNEKGNTTYRNLRAIVLRIKFIATVHILRIRMISDNLTVHLKGLITN